MNKPKNREEYRTELANAFASVLEEKGLEWKKEWRGTGGGAPHNAITNANYRGCNAFWLSLVSMIKGYDDPRWVTMAQIIDKDNKYHKNEKWHLKAGSKATYVEYWMPFDTVEKKTITWERFREELKRGRDENEFGLNSRYTAVFNANEIEGMPGIEIIDNPETNMDDLVRKLSERMNVPIFTDGGDDAYYSPTKDEIHLPTPSSFTSDYAFNATALHELSHSTGHPSRLDRNQSAYYGTDGYAFEELVAEISSCFMGINLNVEASSENIRNHKAYVNGWINTIREKPETLMKAIKDAQTAVNYMEYSAGIIGRDEYDMLSSGIKTMREKSTEHAER